MSGFDPDAAAAEVADALAAGRQIPLFTTRTPAPTLTDAYRTLPRLRTMRGGRLAGRKIGFTNRALWPRYNADAPIWGDVLDHTLLDASAASIPLAGFQQPKLEPELVFGLKSAPTAGLPRAALMACVDWVAPGFELVRSLYADWRFSGPDAVLSGGLHGRLILGARKPASEVALDRLAALSVDLLCDDALIETGAGAAVLGDPLDALAHLVALLAEDPNNPPLGAGEVVTTGSMTQPCDVTPGQSWTARFADDAFAPLTVRFS